MFARRVIITASALLLGPLLNTSLACADDEESRRPLHLEMSARIGVMERATTGTIPAYGYDVNTVPTAGVDLRWFTPWGCSYCDMMHGVHVGFTYAGGSTFGVGRESDYRDYFVDAAYAFRIRAPCLSSRDRTIVLTGTAGFSGRMADAGLGDTPTDNTDRWNERSALASRYDHVALGWRLGFDAEAHFRSFILGIGVDMRQLWGVDTELARTTTMGATLRIGFDAPIRRGPPPSRGGSSGDVLVAN